MSPKVSVIIPTYNRASMVVECIESILAQTYTDYEVIVVDDGSTDNTEQALKPYSGKINYIKQQYNQGLAAARNRGIKEARGEHITFLDNDDIWLPDKLERQMRFLAENPRYDLICGNGVTFGNRKDEGKPVISRKRVRVIKREGLTLRNTYIKGCIYFQTIVIKKSIMEDLGCLDASLPMADDWDFCLRFLLKYKAFFIDEVFFKRRKHSGNFSSNSELNLLLIIRVTEKLLNTSPDAARLIGKECINKKMATTYYKLGRIYCENGQRNKAINAFKKALSYKILYPSCLIQYFLCTLGKAENAGK